MKRLYFRCNGGHYFQSSVGCPFDGWSMEDLSSLVQKFEEWNHQEVMVTMKMLKEYCTNSELVSRILLIEFGEEAAVFQALSPEYYFYQDKVVKAENVGLELF
jgi:hypothetical protein